MYSTFAQWPNIEKETSFLCLNKNIYNLVLIKIGYVHFAILRVLLIGSIKYKVWPKEEYIKE